MDPHSGKLASVDGESCCVYCLHVQHSVKFCLLVYLRTWLNGFCHVCMQYGFKNRAICFIMNTRMRVDPFPPAWKTQSYCRGYVVRPTPMQNRDFCREHSRSVSSYWYSPKPRTQTGYSWVVQSALLGSLLLFTENI